MKKETYSPPKILNHSQIRFETAHSWNRGQGNLNHPGTGDNGVKYPNDPYPGEHNNKQGQK